MRPIRLPEPPSGISGSPEIFARGVHGVIRSAVVIGNGFAGAENQCIGLVRALGLSARQSLYRVNRPRGGINEWLHWLPVSLHKKLEQFFRRINCSWRLQIPAKGHRVMPFSFGEKGLPDILEADANHIANMARENFDKDGPLLVVASGRDTIHVSSSIRRLAPESVFVVQIQHPRSHLSRFDLVVTPRHDYYPLTPHAQEQIPWFLRRWITPCEPPGRNVVLTVGALHQADSAALRKAASAWHDELASLPKPLLVVNIGGPSGNCRYGVDLAKQLASMLQTVLSSCGSVRISFSRRTPEKVSKMLVKELSANPKVYIWDGEGPNPHLGHLAWADAFVITADSVSMLSEACTTGKPVYVIGAEQCTWKFADFQKSLQERGAARPFTGKEDMSESWSYPPLMDTTEAAIQVKEALSERGWSIIA
ncbi:Mitochondrial fission protein ELM1-like [Parasponia andersonii]|uniref:Mitochondrial fission protein ELM1-like n=1 Tax=Parasponia andersonii TaxID=3476 RepID=A0A2P5DXL7_PARAD|nr:Mitochondrial fission protein ELM1-like [Parasponia andersonii]